MTDLRFDQATADEFRAFWEAQGFAVWPYSVTRNTAKGIEVWGTFTYMECFLDSHEVRVGFDPETTTFGEALEILNELANTRAFGGWAKEEGSE